MRISIQHARIVEIAVEHVQPEAVGAPVALIAADDGGGGAGHLVRRRAGAGEVAGDLAGGALEIRLLLDAELAGGDEQAVARERPGSGRC